MRLNNYNNKKPIDSDGPVQTEKKRARPMSSLDIKVDDGHKMTTPPSKDGVKKQTNRNQKDQEQQQQQRRINHISRSRRGRLPSHVKYEGMDEDELRALYEEPEVEADPPKKGDKPSRGYAKRSKSARHPDYLKSQMEKGVPVVQWIIVLLFLGVLVYQLRKSLAGPAKPKKVVAERGTGRKNGKQKGKKQNVKSKGKAKSKTVSQPVEEKRVSVQMSPIEEELVSEELEKPLAEAKTAKKKTNAKKRARNKKTTGKPSANNGQNDEGLHESPDSVSTDGSSTTEHVAQSEEDRMANVSEEKQLRPEDMRVDSQGWQTLKEEPSDEGWHTVGAGGDKNKKKAETKKPDDSPKPEISATTDVETHVEESDSAKAPQTADDSAKAEPEAAKVPVAEESAKPEPEATKAPVANDTAKAATGATPALEAKENMQPTAAAVAAAPQKRANGNKKKKSKKKKIPPPVKEAIKTDNNTNDTIDDAALALKLQKEEEQYASSTPPVETEEVWEEVSTRKKKRPSTPVVEAS